MSESTALETPRMLPAMAPVWAEIFGEDDFGVFAEFSFKAVPYHWRWIPPGRFLMGSPDSETGRYDDEGPLHEVILTQGYWMGEAPLTQRQWEAVTGKKPSRFQGASNPVEQVSWDDCQNFIAELNAHVAGLNAALPTEAQWEYACRAETQGAFHIDGSRCTKPEGLDPALAQLGWFDKNSDGKTHPVKEKQPNKWGLYDMHGNVWEWCQDGRRTYMNKLELNPIGPTDEGADRVVRGGSWDDLARSCRAAYRDLGLPGYVWDFYGLRLSAGQEWVDAEPPRAERVFAEEAVAVAGKPVGQLPRSGKIL